MDKKKCIIVVPIYKETPDILDQYSLRQLDKVINNHDIVIATHDNINQDSYKELFKKNQENLSFEIFDENYFKSIKDYSQLLLTYEFYDRFSNYEYMLIYQTDCWIFKDDIDEFCDMGFDYIGAPILSVLSNWPSLTKLHMKYAIGNGGLSLRKISKMKSLMDRNNYVYKQLSDKWADVQYEDMFICEYMTNYAYISFPELDVALKFSTEFLKPMQLGLIPMGVHRIFMLREAWSSVVPELNNQEVIEACNKNR